MKGQILFVRYSNEGDLAAIAALDSPSGAPLPATGRAVEGLVGRLAGNTVAYLEWYRVGDALTISHIVVSSELRGLRIGGNFVAEAVKLAASEGARWVRVARDCKLAPFFERCGFVSAGETLTKATR